MGAFHTSESITALVRTVCGLHGEWPPYHDELERTLPELERAPGLELYEDVLAIARTGDPSRQQRLEARVEEYMAEHGHPHQWGDDLEPLKALRF